MQYVDEFLSVFGDVKLSDVTMVVFAGIFLVAIYRKCRDYLIKKYEANKKKDEQLKEALESVRKYPEYRQQSIKIQELFESEIQELRRVQEENAKRLEDMETTMNKRERNRIRDILLQNYRYYTNPDTNPNGTWSQMEAETFWALFSDYEEAGGNGLIHTVVQPAMNQLIINDHKVD